MNKRGVGVWGCLSVVFACLASAALTSGQTYADTKLSISTPEDPILEVSLSSNLVQLDLMPKLNSPDFKSSNLTVSVGTNNLQGYSLYMSADSTDLTRTQAMNNTTPVIASLANNAEGYTEANFTANRWGYRLGGGNYLAIPGTETLINSSETQTNQDITTVTFASKVDMNQQAGTYSTNINFIVITDSIPLTMQDIETWRGSLVVNQPVKARDTRNNKSYYVTKLQTADSNPRVATSSDGKKYQIWMTQNLDLDLSTSKPLTSESTDLNSAGSGIYVNGYTTNNGVISWTPMRSTTNDVTNTKNDDATPYSYDPGIVYYYEDASSASSVCNSNDCNHWHIGNYYNWNAAVASNDTSSQATQYAQAENSICPKGWKLPAGMTAADKYTDANYLLVQNGITGGYGAYNVGWLANGYSNIQASPLYIIRSGNFQDENLRATNAAGYLWYDTSSGSNSSYYMSYGIDWLVPAVGAQRRFGYPLRCIDRNDIKITFDANGGTGTMPTQVISNGAGTLNTNTFTYPDYVFTGWNTKPDGSGSSYGNGSNYSGQSTTLYAQWNKTINALTYMQDFASLSSNELEIVKNSMTVNAQYQLIDNRDNKTYYISKLQISNDNPRATVSGDGKKYQIWMTQNLDLDLEASPNNVAALNSNNTDINSNTGIYTDGYSAENGVISWAPLRATTNNINNVQHDNSTPYSYDPGAIYYYQDQNTSSTTCDTGDCAHWSAGNYYNWNASVASNNTTGQVANYTQAQNSICPKGWRLPAGLTGTDVFSDFNYLLVQQGLAAKYVGINESSGWVNNGSSNIQAYPLYIVRSGYFQANMLGNLGTSGYLFTNTSSNTTTVYRLITNSTAVYPAYSGERGIGFPIRCIAR